MKTNLYTIATVASIVFALLGCAPSESPPDGQGGEDNSVSQTSGDPATGNGGSAICRWQYADCDHNPSNGCEVRTSDSDNNCGGCGIVCAAPHASMDCDFSICIVDQCEPGFEDCDRDPANGCESFIGCD